jgi:uncharacterized HAD superfamily protein
MQQFNQPQIALDIDGVLADFMTKARERIGADRMGSPSWYPFYKMYEPSFWKELIADKQFWVNLPALVSPDSLAFEPLAYVTARSIPTEWTQEWIEKVGFPCNPVYTVGTEAGKHMSKLDVLTDIGADCFVEDNFQQFADLNDNGVTCYLMNTYYNTRYQVGDLRIFHLNELLDKQPNKNL